MKKSIFISKKTKKYLLKFLLFSITTSKFLIISSMDSPKYMDFPKYKNKYDYKNPHSKNSQIEFFNHPEKNKIKEDYNYLKKIYSNNPNLSTLLTKLKILNFNFYSNPKTIKTQENQTNIPLYFNFFHFAKHIKEFKELYPDSSLFFEEKNSEKIIDTIYENLKYAFLEKNYLSNSENKNLFYTIIFNKKTNEYHNYVFYINTTSINFKTGYPVERKKYERYKKYKIKNSDNKNLKDIEKNKKIKK